MIKILTTLVAATITVTSVHAQTNTVRETPRLVVGITIDQLRGDYLESFQGMFSERGFKRLLSGGLVYQNVSFDFPNLDDASAIATIYTGAPPFYHGIVGTEKYIAKDKQIAPTFADNNYLGNYTQDKVSPLALHASTLTDELKIATGGSSDVFSFAPRSAQALASAGRLGDCAFWVDEYNGQWASSTYYNNFYWVVDQENRSNNGYQVKSWGYVWSPLQNNTNRAFPYSQGSAYFQHTFGSDKETYKLYKKSPLINESIRSIAIKVMSKSEMGQRVNPDFLALTFYAGNYPGAPEYSAELQDIYIRLDKEIETLLDEIDKAVGLKNTFIFLTSTGYYKPNPTQKGDALDLKDGTFFANRCEALLNMYLMAIYGQEQWVDRYYNEQIFLNRQLIENKNLSLKEVQQKAAEFVSEFTGVQNVYTSYQIKLGEWNPVMEFYKNGFTKETAGDLFVEIQPGYKVANEKNHNFETKQIQNNAVICPVIFFGNGIQPEKIKRTIRATEIAPSVAYVMRIRPPNAAKDQPLPELFN